MRRCGSMSSSPLAAVALFLLFHVAGCCFHCAAEGRLLPSSVPVPADLVHHAENGFKAADGAAADAGLVLQEAGQGSVANGDELSISEMMGAESEEKPCEEGNDECMQRRLLHEAHLDYIYTQHKGKP